MTDNLKPFLGENDKSGDRETSPEPDRLPPSEQPDPKQPDKWVAIHLPSDVVAAIQQRMDQSGQSQAQIILHMLQSALDVEHPPEAEAAIPKMTTPSPVHPAEPSPDWINVFETVKARLQHLESLIPKLEDLEGKSIAF